MKKLLTLIACSWAASLAYAAIPAAVWDGDFKTAVKGNYTLNANGNTVADDGSIITIGAKGVKVWRTDETAQTSGMTVLYKYSGMTFNRKQALATVYAYTNGSRVGVELQSNNVSKGIYIDQEWSGEKGAATSTFTTGSGTIALTYKSNGDTGGTYCYYVANGTRTLIYGCGDLKENLNSPKGVNVGGMHDTTISGATGTKIAAIAVFEGVLSEAEMKGYVWPSESGAYEASVGSGAAAWRDLMWRKGTGTPVSTADLPDGSTIHVTVSLGATLTISADDQAQLAAKGIGLKATQFTNGGTVKFSGGTAESPIAFAADGEANIDLGVWTIAADTYVKVTPNSNKLYRVTGADRATSILEFARTDDGTGATDGTVFRSLTLVANVTAADRQYWIERTGSFDASVDVVAAGPITVYERGQTIGALSGSGDIVKYEGATYTLTLTPSADADYSGASSHNFTIAGTAVQTLSGAFTGALTVNSGATVGLDGDRVAPSAITGPGTVRKVGTGTTTIAVAKVSKSTKPAAIEVAGGTLNFSAGQFFSEASENVALPLTVTGGTLNLNGAWTYTGGDGSGWLYSKPITIGGGALGDRPLPNDGCAIVGGSVTPYYAGELEMLHYVGGEGVNAPAIFGAAIYSTYQKDNRVRRVNVEKGRGSAEGGFDLEMTGVLGTHNDSAYLNAFLFTKTGEGVLRVSNANNFPNTTVSAGTYQLGCPEALPANLSVASGATLDLGGFAITNRSLTCAGTIDNGALVSSGVTVDLTGATLGDNLTLAADLANAVAGTRPFAGVDTSRVTTVGESKYLTYDPATGTFTLRDDCKLGDELKWLPLGDSITEGEQYMGHPGEGTGDTRGGYRYALWNDLEQAGQVTRSFGYRTGHQGTEEDPDTCRWAWHAAQYGGVIMHDSTSNPNHGSAGMNVENTLEVAGYPDIVTVLIGVNDLSFVSSSAAYEWVFATWRNMVAKYADQRPHTKIVVSTLLPAGGGRMNYIAPFNAFVRNAARDKTAPFDRANVVFADIAKIAFNDTFQSAYFKSDTLHPNEPGARVVASAWMSVLQPLVAEIAQSNAVPVQIHNATTDKISVRYSKAIKSISSATLTITGTNVNGQVVNRTFTDPTISPSNPRIIEFDADGALGDRPLPDARLIAGDYTATLADVVGTDANNIPLPDGGLPGGQPLPAIQIYGTGAAENIPAAYRKGFERMQTIDVTEGNYGGNGPNAPCANLTKPDPLSHVGYYVELQRPNEAPQFVWVSMEAAPFGYMTNNVGVPTVKSGVIRSKVTELQVFGNHGNFTNTAIGDTTQTGVIEFSPWVAGSADAGGGFPTEFKPNHYGWNDTLTDTSNLWGCMQVARETHVEGPDDYTKIAGEMIFAFNTFNSNKLTDLGIGTFSTHRNNAGDGITPVLDWTDFAQSTGYTKFMLSAYKVKKIEIWVKGVMDPTMFCVCGPVQHDILNELMPRPRSITVGASVPLARPSTSTSTSTPGYYELRVKNGVATITGDAEGQRYAQVTFDQLKALAAGQPIPDCTIVDWPEFKYRGLMLDCGRNFQSLESIYDIIDHLAKYKMNVFHWHLTDNPGWRLESSLWPQLQYDKAFTRQIGQYYTRQQFKDVVAYAKARGILVIPELDMPGHTAAFRRGLEYATLISESARNDLGDLIQELCNLVPAEDMPIIHLGTDEATGVESVPQSYVDYWANIVIRNGRKVMGWSPGYTMNGQNIKQLWRGANDPRGDTCPYIDSQNSYYINHVDPEELLSVAAYQQPCRWGQSEEKLGAIIGVWHDDCIAETEDVARMNAVYPAVVLLSDNFWRGREKDEPTLYARIPAPDDPRFALAADLERRTIAQRDRVLKDLNHPFPYVAQTQMRWRMTDADTGAVVATDIPQATTYPQHFWFPASKFVDKTSGNIVLETWITSPRTQRCGAWIDMTGFSRSDGRKRDNPTPAIGQWNRHGATLTVNGTAIAPPRWTHPAQSGDSELPLVDEGYHYRAPSSILLKSGVNHIKLTLPKSGGWKWIGTFTPILGTSDHPREVPDLKYSSTAP